MHTGTTRLTQWQRYPSFGSTLARIRRFLGLASVTPASGVPGTVALRVLPATATLQVLVV